jgi:hypothetical protein
VEKDWTKLPGYFKKKASSPIESVDEFIRIVRSQKIIKKFFAANDPNFAGIRAMLDVFYGKIRSIMCEDPAMAGDIDIQMKEIHEYVMLQLHNSFFDPGQQSNSEIKLEHKLKKLKDLEPSAFGIDERINMELTPDLKYAWNLAKREMLRIS